MTRIKYYLFLLAVLALGLSSCSKDQEYLNALPADAHLVCAFELEPTLKKSGLLEANIQLRQRITRALTGPINSNGDIRGLLQGIKQWGVSIKSPVYAFANEKIDVGYLMRVDNVEKLKKTSRDVLKFFGKDPASVKSEDGVFIYIDEESRDPGEVGCYHTEDGFSTEGGAAVDFTEDSIARQECEGEVSLPDTIAYHHPGDVSIVAFNDKALITLFTSKATIEEAKQLAKRYLSQKRGQSYAATPAFQDMEKQKGDIRGVLSLRPLASDSYPFELFTELGKLSLPLNIGGIDLKMCHLLFAFSFELGELKGSVTYGSEDQVTLEKLRKLTSEIYPTTIQEELIKYLPKDSYITAAAAFSARKLLEQYREDPCYQELLSELKANSFDLEAIAPTLGDEIAFSFPRIAEDWTDPQYGFVVYLKTKDATLVDALYQQAEKKIPGRHTAEGAHRYFVAEGPFVYGYKNGVSYFAYGLMGKDDLFKSGGADFTRHKSYHTLKETNSFAYIDLKKFVTNPATASISQFILGDKASLLESLTFTTSGSELQMSLKLSSTDNVLNTLLDAFLPTE